MIADAGRLGAARRISLLHLPPDRLASTEPICWSNLPPQYRLRSARGRDRRDEFAVVRYTRTRKAPAADNRASVLIVGEVKIRHSGDMGSSSRRAALYHGFLEQTVTSVTVTSLLQRGYSGQRNVRECTGET